MLTKKQIQLLEFIQRRMARDGVPPSFDEMKDALDLRSKSGIHRLVTALEERGFIRRLPHRARALEVLRLPDALSHLTDAAPEETRPAFTPRVISNTRPRSTARRDDGRRQPCGSVAPDGPYRRRRADRGDFRSVAPCRRAGNDAVGP